MCSLVLYQATDYAGKDKILFEGSIRQIPHTYQTVAALHCNGSSYATSKEFVAFFLQSPITKEPDFEIRISADNAAVVDSIYESLRKQKIPFRKLGLPVFPPPLMLLFEFHLAKSALQVLRSWYNGIVRDGKKLPA